MIVLRGQQHRLRSKGEGATHRAPLTLGDLRAVMRPGVRYSRSSLAKISGSTEIDLAPIFEARGLRPVSHVRSPAKPRLEALQIPDVAEILEHIADLYLIQAADILGHSHLPEFVEPRHEAMAVVWELNRYALAELGELFNRTNEGVIYGLRRHYERLHGQRPSWRAEWRPDIAEAWGR